MTWVSAPKDIEKGTALLTAQAQAILPFFDLVSRSRASVLWVINTSSKAIEVSFQASPDGLSPDMETLGSVGCDPGKSVSLGRTPLELRRYWAICALCPTYQAGDVIRVAYGITISLES